ncbi:RNA polymerase Rpb3/RpoA insert domain-containing protein [Pseudomassariella vexata]|uniref:DNA-directed RNA polymerases I and III subunit RPAC1 n=1 Tax=Pseudomassariella vexata TaxID=1141098 RepID=A0A1Y2DDY8_9PEZI|nr:RNA polymerase Rpb3/RpoA insert domain-containing protein [Pseudomassariella vexata]ORY57492.1 RNA polymerase Rpb3/RpoA insert domain-containing protein [Pseudomassariella vexata]
MAPSSGRRLASRTKEEPEERKIVGINKETVTNTVSTDYPDNFIDEDHAWDVDYFRSKFRVEWHENNEHEAQFSLIGLDASIANAFRRILIAEIPTLAIEKVFMNNNTSVIQDEVLAHRLGLIPFTGGKKGIRDWMTYLSKDADGQDLCFDHNTVQLSLSVECTKNKDAKPDETDPTKLYHNAHVYARDIVFQPLGDQEKWFSGDDIIRPVNPDILIAKLRPPQVLDMDLHMHKGIGADHAKFSPVCTASYRLLPTITITKPILGDDAKKFQECFMPGTIKLEKVTRQEARQAGSGYEGHEGENKAVVANAMYDTVSREVLRHDEFQGKVKLGRKRDHFIFSIESSGQWDSDELFLESVKVMKQKVGKLRQLAVTMVTENSI